MMSNRINIEDWIIPVASKKKSWLPVGCAPYWKTNSAKNMSSRTRTMIIFSVFFFIRTFSFPVMKRVEKIEKDEF